MKASIVLILIGSIFILTACGPDEENMERAARETFAAVRPTDVTFPTRTAAPSEMPTTTPTPVEIIDGECIPLIELPETGQVVRVIDGDTISVLIQNRDFQVQLIGVDATRPANPGTNMGNDAASENRRLLEGETVVLFREPGEEDPDRPLKRYVVVDDQFVNLLLIRRGLARFSNVGIGEDCAVVFDQAERQARSAQLGLWARTATPTITLQSTQTAAAQETSAPAPTVGVVEPTGVESETTTPPEEEPTAAAGTQTPDLTGTPATEPAPEETPSPEPTGS